MTDAFRRFFMAGPTEQGHGLRGGTLRSSEDETGATVELAGYRFVEDVAVTGSGRYDFETGSIDANISLALPGSSGQLRVTGVWFAPGASTLTVDGRIGGRRVVVEVPAT